MTKPSKVLILGSGPIVIGQAAEFDYSGTQACRSLTSRTVDLVFRGDRVDNAAGSDDFTQERMRAGIVILAAGVSDGR